MALYSGINSPLFQAKQNLWLAFQNYSAGRKTEAGSYLKHAREFLEKAIAGKSAAASEETGKLSQEVAALEKKLASEGKIAESEFKSLWKKSEALAERSAAYVSAGLTEAETTLGGENALIEAKLHVTYAETYQLLTKEPGKASKELDKAYSYLQKAAASSLAGPGDRKKILELENVLLTLKTGSDMRADFVHGSYDTIKEELNVLVQKI